MFGAGLIQGQKKACVRELSAADERLLLAGLRH
jgi:hypothetical protein